MNATIKLKRPTNPRKDANIFSIVTYTYVLPIILKAYSVDLEEDDIPNVPDGHVSSKLGDKLESAWNYEREIGRNSLWNAIRRIFGNEFRILGALLSIDELVLRLMRPLAVAQLLKYYLLVEDGELPSKEVFICCAVIVIISLLSSIIGHFATFNLQVLGLKIRIACCSLIYRKALLLSKSSLANTTIGKVTNLLSNDVGRIDNAVCSAHGIWYVPIQIVLTIAAMYYCIGVKAIVGVIFMILLVPIQVFLGKLLSRLRLTTAFQTDERVRLMNEIVYGIKVIKMYTWEKLFEELVLEKRRTEMSKIRYSNYIRSFMKSAIYTPKIAIFITIMLCVLTGDNLTAVYVFTVAAFYDTLKQSVCICFIKGIADVSEVRVSIDRIKTFLLYEEQSKRQEQKYQEVKLELTNVTAKWLMNSPDPTLNDVTLKIYSGDHVALIGPVGSGKSSLLEMFLNELQVQSGDVNVKGSIAYASQEPWIFSGTIQQNILFGKPMNTIRYKSVIGACALDEDFQILQYGDQTLVGERGVTLSGGQKARINLARAIYIDSDIYLLDDPFSAVDTRVGLHIFQNCIEMYLSNKCVVLVTHQLQYLHHFETVHLIENGRISVSGSVADIMQYGSKFSTELRNTSREEAAVPSESKVGKVLDWYQNKETTEGNKSVSSGIPRNYYLMAIRSSKSMVNFILVMILMLISQLSIATGEYFITCWVNQKYIFDIKDEPSSTESFVYGYSGITTFMMATVLLQGIAFFAFCNSISLKLHNKMLSSLINTTLLFFNQRTSGKILSLFSKDIGIIDEQIPMAAIESLQITYRLLLGLILINLCNYWLIIYSVALLLGFYFLRKLYHPTNRRLKLYETNARCPILGHLNETLQGISTVRAFGAQKILKKEFDLHQDFYSSVWDLFLSSTRILIFYTDVLCVLYITGIMFTLLLIQKEQLGGNVGLAITQGIVILTSVQWGMLQFTELENSMEYVKNVLDYTNLEPEEAIVVQKPPPSWPAQGKIDFKSVSLKYCANGPTTLKNLNLTISPGSRIGVVGRTGAGKSSLISALFQLVRTQGVILIDDIDVTNISLHSLRSKLSIIPQEPVLFSGTIRKNLDPFTAYSDEQLWQSLNDVELKSVFVKMPAGLNSVISEGGSNLSAGQRQLVCLARAVLRKNNILVLDEPTANVDPYTDALIQNTLRKKFDACTVITVAHRLNTIMDCDKILVLQDGVLVEFDSPNHLLQNSNGIFKSMVQQTGCENAKYLVDISKRALFVE